MSEILGITGNAFDIVFQKISSYQHTYAEEFYIRFIL